MIRLLSLAFGVFVGLFSTVNFAAADGPAAKSTALSPHIDLRPQFKEFGLTPRSQGHRNTCSVFTTAAALEFALSKHTGKGTPLSPEYLNWATNQITKNDKDTGQFFHNLLQGFEKYGICTEAEMPYQPKFDPTQKPSDKAKADAKKNLGQHLKVHWINPWKKEQGLTDKQIVEIKEVLAKGWPVAAGSDHSRLLVGYTDDAKQPGGGTFITKDSGSGKFDSVTYEFARKKIGDVFWVDAPLKNEKTANSEP
jgi:C1A family cysteine protease